MINPSPRRSDPNCQLGCRDGWLGENADGLPVPCPNCKQHLAVCRDCGSWKAAGVGHWCAGTHRGRAAEYVGPPPRRRGATP